jgi:hypothetical protein
VFPRSSTIATTDVVASYVREKERTQADCRNDPLFLQIPISSAKKKLKLIKDREGRER